MTGTTPTIPLMRPQLPEAGEILDYLHAIDARRWYTNFGPLVRDFERRLAAHWGVPEGALHFGRARLTLQSVVVLHKR